MASVYERNGRWVIRFKDAQGRWKAITTNARGKTEARRMAEDLERKAERQRLGLEAAPAADGGGTVDALLDWWLETYSAGAPAHASNVSYVRKHLIGSELGKLRLVDLRSGDIETFLQRKSRGTPADDEGPLAPQTVNHLRRYIVTAFNCAKRAGRWEGPNPAEQVKRRKVPRRAPGYLKAQEVPLLLQSLQKRWHPLFATAIYTGLRKGELLGAKKADVDLKARLFTVARSWDRETTKGGHADAIPIAAELVPFLEAAIRASPSDLLFPNEDGTMMRRDVALEDILRRAMARAGLVTGFTHVCRKKGCKHREDAPDAALRRCPKDGMKLWPKGKVRPIRFHDLRHTTASLLMMAGANPAAVQRILRHADPRITTEVYGHLAPEYLRAEIDRLTFGVKSEQQAAELIQIEAAVGDDRFVAPVSPTAERSSKEPETEEISPSIPGSSRARDTGFEPVAFGSGGPEWGHPGVTNGSHPVSSRAVTAERGVQKTRPVGPFRREFVTPVLPAASLRTIDGGADHLLSVRQVAERLGVSTATVYKLVAAGQLPHVRVSNTIRIPPSTVAAYVKGTDREPHLAP
jgi:integrase